MTGSDFLLCIWLSRGIGRRRSPQSPKENPNSWKWARSNTRSPLSGQCQTWRKEQSSTKRKYHFNVPSPTFIRRTWISLSLYNPPLTFLNRTNTKYEISQFLSMRFGLCNFLYNSRPKCRWNSKYSRLWTPIDCKSRTFNAFIHFMWTNSIFKFKCGTSNFLPFNEQRLTLRTQSAYYYLCVWLITDTICQISEYAKKKEENQWNPPAILLSLARAPHMPVINASHIKAIVSAQTGDKSISTKTRELKATTTTTTTMNSSVPHSTSQHHQQY